MEFFVLPPLIRTSNKEKKIFTVVMKKSPEAIKIMDVVNIMGEDETQKVLDFLVNHTQNSINERSYYIKLLGGVDEGRRKIREATNNYEYYALVSTESIDKDVHVMKHTTVGPLMVYENRNDENVIIMENVGSPISLERFTKKDTYIEITKLLLMLNGKKIIHGDLNRSNITFAGRVYFIDFEHSIYTSEGIREIISRWEGRFPRLLSSLAQFTRDGKFMDIFNVLTALDWFIISEDFLRETTDEILEWINIESKKHLDGDKTNFNKKVLEYLER